MANGDDPRPSPTRVTYDVKELFAEIRDQLRDLNKSISTLAEAKADKSQVQALEQRIYVIETMGSRHAQELDKRVQAMEAGTTPLAVQFVGEHRGLMEDVASLKTEKAERGAVENLQRRLLRVGVSLGGLIVAAASAIVIALK